VTLEILPKDILRQGERYVPGAIKGGGGGWYIWSFQRGLTYSLPTFYGLGHEGKRTLVLSNSKGIRGN